MGQRDRPAPGQGGQPGAVHGEWHRPGDIDDDGAGLLRPGLPDAIDFPVAFGSYPSRCVPSVDWSPKNPPLSLSAQKLVHVIEISPSWKAPHAVRDEAGGWFFAKRTSEGNAAMTIEEVRGGFLGVYEKRMKLHLLRAELESVRLQAGEMIIMGSDLDKKTSLATFDLTVIESVLADAYTILASSPDLLGKLREIRRHCRSINRWVNILAPVFYMPISSKNSLITDHNLRVMSDATNIGRLVDEAMPLLEVLTA